MSSLAAALSEHYRIERLLGDGGMATVYLAHDLKHDRPVALKLLKAEAVSRRALSLDPRSSVAAYQLGTELAPLATNHFLGPYLQHQLVKIYMLAGENEQALNLLEPLLKIPYDLSPGWLRIDPAFRSLRGNPRFEKLIAGSGSPSA